MLMEWLDENQTQNTGVCRMLAEEARSKWFYCSLIKCGCWNPKPITTLIESQKLILENKMKFSIFPASWGWSYFFPPFLCFHYSKALKVAFFLYFFPPNVYVVFTSCYLFLRILSYLFRHQSTWIGYYGQQVYICTNAGAVFKCSDSGRKCYSRLFS